MDSWYSTNYNQWVPASIKQMKWVKYNVICNVLWQLGVQILMPQLGVPRPWITNPIASLGMTPLCNPTLVPLFLPNSFIACPPPHFPPPKPSLGNPIPLLLREAHIPNNLHIIITKISILEQLEFSLVAQHASSSNGQTLKGTCPFLGAHMSSLGHLCLQLFHRDLQLPMKPFIPN